MRLTKATARWRYAAAIMAMGCLVAPVQAQMIVNDPLLIGGQLRQMTKDALEFGKQAQRWTDTYRHYQQQLIRLRRIDLGIVQPLDAFAPRGDDYGMQDLCPGASGLRAKLEGVLSQAMPKLDGNLVDEQQTICQRMVHAENAKYNESVRMLQTLVRRNQQFQSIQAQRDSVGDSQGALAANDNEAQRFMIRTQLDLDHWQARMRAYDDYLAALKWDQSRLARRALGGKKASLAGEVIQAATLKAALAR
ncbi:MAG: hypothetical protein ACREP7_03800 [Lysobacter sp.]